MRRCGPCTECCSAVGVPELEKPPHAKCGFVIKQGCGIYEKRPESCRTFKCVWLEEGTFHRKDRPDKIGMVVATQNTPDGMALAAFVTRPGAETKGRAKALLDKWASKYLIFIARPDGSRSIMGPESLVRQISAIEEHGVGGQKVTHRLRVLS